MSGANVQAAVTSAGQPCAHMAWVEGTAPELPWCVYYLDEQRGVAADNRLQAKRYNWIIEHYWKTYDAEKTSALEAAIEDAFGPYESAETWVEEENCVMTAYYFREIGD